MPHNPIVGFVYPPLPAWRPDTVWPLVIGAGIVWSPSFLPAGMAVPDRDQPAPDAALMTRP